MAEGRATSKAKIEYVAVATEDPHKVHKQKRAKAIETGNWGVQIVDDIRVQNFIGLVIIINGAVIGLETDLPDVTNWNNIEDGFVVFFAMEILLKLFAEGGHYWSTEHPDFWWNMFDIAVMSVALLDLCLSWMGRSATTGFVTLFRMIRLLRILRLLRLLKFLKRLYLLAMGLAEACKAVAWVTVLMCFALYVFAVVLVKTLGKTSESDPHHVFLQERFGDIGRAMITCFILMSSPNLPIYQDEVGLLEAKPFLCMFLILFITFGTFGMVGMLTGVINESMFENNELRKEEKRHEHEEMRRHFGDACADLFEDLNADQRGEVPIEDVKLLAPDTLSLLEKCGARIAHGDMLKFIDSMDADDSGTINAIEFKEAMETICEGINPLCVLQVEKKVGHCTQELSKVEDKLLNAMGQMEDKWSYTKDILARLQSREDKRSEDEMARLNQVISIVDSRMQNLAMQLDKQESRICNGFSKELSDLTKAMQQTSSAQVGGAETLRSELLMGMRKLSTQVEFTDDLIQATLTHQMNDIRRGVSTLLEPKDQGNRAFQGSVIEEVQRVVKSAKLEEGTADDLCLKMADKLDQSVTKQVGEMQTAVCDLIDKKQESDETLFSAFSKQLFQLQTSMEEDRQANSLRMTRIAGQLSDVQKAAVDAAKLKAPGFLASVTEEQLQGTNEAVNKMLEQWRAIANEASLNAVVSRHSELIQRSVQKFIDQKDSSENRLQLAVSSQIQDIATAVQKLLIEREAREGSRDPRDGASIEASLALQIADLKNGIQRHIDSTQENVLKSVAELGGDIVGGLAHIMANKKAGPLRDEEYPTSEDLPLPQHLPSQDEWSGIPSRS